MTSKPSPKSLPGFLRRTLRNAYDPEEDEEAEEYPSGIFDKKNNGHNVDAKEGAAAASSKSLPPPPFSDDDSSQREENGGSYEEHGKLDDDTSSVLNRRFRLSFISGSGRSDDDNVDCSGSPAPSPIKRSDRRSIHRSSSVPSENSDGDDNGDVVGDLPPASSSNLSISSVAMGTPAPSPASYRPTYKEVTFHKMITATVVDLRDLRRLGWNGIPPKHRSASWRILLGYLPTNSSRRIHTLHRKRSEYKDAIAQHFDIDDDTRTASEQETLRQVLVDVPRTAPDIGLFRNERIRRILARLLYIWAMRHPASSYVQGINDLATPLIAVLLNGYFEERDVLDGTVMNEVTDDILDEVEADCYWCLTNLLAGIQDHYTSDQPGVQRMVMRLEDLVTRIDADLTNHLKARGIEFMQFSFKWMNCLLLREFNLPCAIRLWDTYLSEEGSGFEDFHVYVCAAFLCQFSAQVRTMEFDEMFGFMQNIPTEDWGNNEIEILLSQAFVLSTLFDGSDAHLNSQRT